MSCGAMLNFYKSHQYNKLKKLLSSVDVAFGFDKVLYTWISKKGDFFQIGNHHESAEFYYQKRLYTNNPLFVHPDNYLDRRPFFWDEIASHEALIDQAIVDKKFGFKRFFFYPKIIHEDLHLVGFSTTNPQLAFATLACQNQQALFSFAEHLIGEWSCQPKNMDAYIISLMDIVGEDFFTQRTSINPAVDPIKIKKLGASLSSLDPTIAIDKLTKRERECCLHLLDGKMAFQIAQTLGINTRTVFFYIDNVKNKLGCDSKSELISMLRQCEKMSLF